MKKHFLYSLQGRYAAVTCLVAVILLAATFFTQIELQNTRSTTAQNIEERSELQKSSRLIRDSIRKIQLSLTTFLVDPGVEDPRQNIHGYLHAAKQSTDSLWLKLWEQNQEIAAKATQLRANLDQLENEIDNLIDTRTDINRQYPALALTRETMLANQTDFHTTISLAMNEEHLEDAAHHSMTSYKAFIQTRHLWSTMLSTFRIYLANRLGSFDEPALPDQEASIATQFETLTKHLDQMKLLDETGQLGSHGSAYLEKLNSAAWSWFKDFEKVRNIHSQDDWRSDIRIVRESITPRTDAIWRLLFELDKTIEQASNNDVSMLTKVAVNQTQVLWLFSGFCILLTLVGYYAFKRTVLHPLRGIARALKAESDGEKGLLLPKSNSQETQDLVDSFVAMRSQVRERQQALEYNALHDGLTNLANRTCLNEHLEQSLKTTKRQQGNLALLILDLDHFKEVNDTLGHQMGDQLLLKVSDRLSGLMRRSDLIARFGGDEFAVLLPDTNQSHAVKVAEKIVAELLQPFNIDNQQLYIGASIGISIYPQHGLTVETLTRHSDIAMYMAKRNKTGWALYQSEQDEHSIDRLELMNDLRTALLEKTLQLYFQPKISLVNGSTESVEALLRWQHPTHGFIRPDLIIAMAEQTGLIHELTHWVLENAIRQTLKWHQQDMKLSVAVNLSAYSLHNDDIVEYVKTVLDDTGFPASHLTLEITENAMMADPKRAVKILNKFDAMGAIISVDDYGTGFSSLGYLKQLPVKELKIDKSFIMDVIEDENDAVIVRSTIDMAHSLGLRVVAEGVETREIWDLLQMLGCDIAQGFYMSKPSDAETCTQWLKAPKLLPVPGNSDLSQQR